jgi:hypothetical protein
LLSIPILAGAQDSASRYDRGRFTIVAYKTDELLARSVLASAVARDTFPGLARPTQRVVIAIAPDHRRFREWIGPTAPEWGAAVAFPESSRIVMQGRDAGSDAGDPVAVLRHELAHLALHEALGNLPPRWFDEGYASYAANEVVAARLANPPSRRHAAPRLPDAGFAGGSLQPRGRTHWRTAPWPSSRPGLELGLTLFFRYWKKRCFWRAPCGSAYGITQDSSRRSGGHEPAADTVASPWLPTSPLRLR